MTSDLHLTAEPSSEYRWGLFPWLRGECIAHGVKTLLILGDLTDAKDNHSAELVNRIVRSINLLPVPDIRILAGNHDWLKQGHAFFRFLNLMPAVEFITEITADKNSPASALFLPYTKTPAKDWEPLSKDLDFDFVFMHQTVKGAIASNGQPMDGEGVPDLYKLGFDGVGGIFSGDIHVPQVIRGVEYVGSPYHVHFGDSFKPRCLLFRGDDDAIDLRFPTISRVTLKVGSLEELKTKRLQPGDQIKLRMELTPQDRHSWLAIKLDAQAWLVSQEVEVYGIELVGGAGGGSDKKGTHPIESSKITAPEAILRFVEAEGLPPDIYDSGIEIIES